MLLPHQPCKHKFSGVLFLSLPFLADKCNCRINLANTCIFTVHRDIKDGKTTQKHCQFPFMLPLQHISKTLVRFLDILLQNIWQNETPSFYVIVIAILLSPLPSWLDTFIMKVFWKIFITRSLGDLRAPTSSLRPFRPLWLRPSRPSGAQAVWPM